MPRIRLWLSKRTRDTEIRGISVRLFFLVSWSELSDRSMRFLDEKLQTFGQFWAAEKVNATLNAWAIINNLRTFLPDAKRAGQ